MMAGMLLRARVRGCRFPQLGTQMILWNIWAGCNWLREKEVGISYMNSEVACDWSREKEVGVSSLNSERMSDWLREKNVDVSFCVNELASRLCLEKTLWNITTDLNYF